MADSVGNTDAGVSLYAFASPADADAVFERWHYQEVHYLEQLATLHTGTTFAEGTHGGFRRFAVVHYNVNGAERFIVTEYLATIGSDVLVVTGAQTAQTDGALTTPVLDPRPAMDFLLQDVLDRFSAAGITG
jgi:hypothetical protein